MVLIVFSLINAGQIFGQSITIPLQQSQAEPGQADKQPIALIVAQENFWDEELSVPRTLFTKAGYRVVIFSSSLGLATGMLVGRKYDF